MKIVLEENRRILKDFTGNLVNVIRDHSVNILRKRSFFGIRFKWELHVYWRCSAIFNTYLIKVSYVKWNFIYTKNKAYITIITYCHHNLIKNFSSICQAYRSLSNFYLLVIASSCNIYFCFLRYLLTAESRRFWFFNCFLSWKSWKIWPFQPTLRN